VVSELGDTRIGPEAGVAVDGGRRWIDVGGEADRIPAGLVKALLGQGSVGAFDDGAGAVRVIADGLVEHPRADVIRGPAQVLPPNASKSFLAAGLAGGNVRDFEHAGQGSQPGVPEIGGESPAVQAPGRRGQGQQGDLIQGFLG
jgi:hypothetical protein